MSVIVVYDRISTTVLYDLQCRAVKRNGELDQHKHKQIER